MFFHRLGALFHWLVDHGIVIAYLAVVLFCLAIVLGLASHCVSYKSLNDECYDACAILKSRVIDGKCHCKTTTTTWAEPDGSH